MYCDHFGLREKPFTIVPNPACLYPSTKHALALTYLEYGLTEGSGFILLTGEIGVGKTTLIKHLLRDMGPEAEVAVVFNTNVTGDELLRQVLREFEIEPGADKSADLDLLNGHLIARYAAGGQPLLIVDEAQNLSRDALEEVRMLSNLQTETTSLLRIMLVGQPELRDRMRAPELRQLAQRVCVSFHIGPLDRGETGAYIRHRLASAGYQGPGLFSPEAEEAIHVAARGIPRTINILCDAALVYAFADAAAGVDAAVVAHVLRDREADLCEGTAPAQGDASEAPPGAVLPVGQERRLARLEARMDKLAALLEGQCGDLQDRADADRNTLVLKLDELLQQERRTSDRLLAECSEYRRCIQKMEHEIKTLRSPARDDGDRPGAPARGPSARRWSGLLAWLRNGRNR